MTTKKRPAKKKAAVAPAAAAAAVEAVADESAVRAGDVQARNDEVIELLRAQTELLFVIASATARLMFVVEREHRLNMGARGPEEDPHGLVARVERAMSLLREPANPNENEHDGDDHDDDAGEPVSDTAGAD